jgi:isopentenyldiphosphate isomerase
MNTAHPPIQLADENDKVWRGGTMDEAQLNGYWHRVIRVMVFDSSRGIYLLQKVPPNPYYDGDLWNVTSSGHVDEGESYIEAAGRELAEEMGIMGLRLVEVARFKTIEHKNKRTFNRHNVTFIAEADQLTLNVRPNRDEVSDERWISKSELKTMAEQQPETMTSGLWHFAKESEALTAHLENI